MDMPQKYAAVLVGLGLAIGGASITAEAVAQHHDVQFRHVAIPDRPCASDDGPAPCFWDAGVRGDGHGRSFWLDRRTHVHYLDGGEPAREPYGGCKEAAQPGNPVPPECR